LARNEKTKKLRIDEEGLAMIEVRQSTTLRLILGLDAPDSGSATIGGRPYRRLRWPLREVGAMLEARAFHPGRAGGG
jgi:hypothetical protein